MKTIIAFLFFSLSFCGFSQDTIKQTDTTQKTIVINPLPVEVYNVIKNSGTGIEVTMYTSEKTFSLPKNAGSNYFLSFIEGNPTTDFNKTNSAYIMILVNDDFYMDAEVSISEKNSYIVFKKDGVKYYNKLNQKGIDFFKKFM